MWKFVASIQLLWKRKWTKEKTSNKMNKKMVWVPFGYDYELIIIICYKLYDVDDIYYKFE